MRRIISMAIWFLVGLIVAIVVLLNVPTVQQLVGSKTAGMLSRKLGTSVILGRVDVGFLNRVIIDDFHMKDQKGEEMLTASRLSAKIDYLELIKGHIVVTSAQLFGLRAQLYQDNADADYNFQFVLDSLASRDTTSHTPLNLRINSLIIRHGNVSFNKRHVTAISTDAFTPDHIHATGLSGHIILNALQDDSLNLNVKKLAFKEASGFTVRNLTFKLTANRQRAQVSDFSIRLPHSGLALGELKADYQFKEGKFDQSSLMIHGSIEPSRITPSELGCFIIQLKNINTPIDISSTFNATSTSMDIGDLHLRTADHGVILSGSGRINTATDYNQNVLSPSWNADIRQSLFTENSIKDLQEQLRPYLKIPQEVLRLGDISYVGTFGGNSNSISAQGHLSTDAGAVDLNLNKSYSALVGSIDTDELSLKRILDNNQLGSISAHLKLEGEMPEGKSLGNSYLKLKGSIPRLDFKQYSYNNIDLDGTLRKGVFDGQIAIDDPNVQLNLWGVIAGLGAKTSSLPHTQITADVQHLRPSALHITDRWGNADLTFNITTDFVGLTASEANGYINIGQFQMITPTDTLAIDNIHLATDHQDSHHRLNIESNFADIEIDGQYDYNTLTQSLAAIVGSKLPTLPGLPRSLGFTRNNFTLSANISQSQWLQQLLGIPITLTAPMQLDAHIADQQHQITLEASLPHFSYNGNQYRDFHLNINTPDDTLRTSATICRVSDSGQQLQLVLNADAADNHVAATLQFANNAQQPMSGHINADARFFKKENNVDAAHIDIHTSNFTIGDTQWEVEPGTIVYSKDDLTIDHLAVKNGTQHLTADGRATSSATDTLTIDLADIDVAYILDLLNFHSVEFDGRATGQAHLTALFDQPEAQAKLIVNDFRFQDGRLGTLDAYARLNNTLHQIDIDAVASENLNRAYNNKTVIVKGNVSPQRNDIDLHITPYAARGEFLESFCGSFMSQVDLDVTGQLRLHGPLNSINLTGEATVDGSLCVTPLGTIYQLKHVPVILIPDEISFPGDTIYDNRNNIGILTGKLYHRSLKQLTYDIGVDAKNLLAFDQPNFGDDTFCGTVYATGNCQITGRSGEVIIDANVSPEENSEIRYNAASPDAIANDQFIAWHDRSLKATMPDFHSPSHQILYSDTHRENSSDIHFNLLINANPNATLRVIMDSSTGDNIALQGNGSLRATYYNKGAFDLYGNYHVTSGNYRLTLQNVIRKEFQFQSGGTIAFGGDPYNAALNLQALYTLPAVPLSDLSIGRSFTSNNIRVDCIMNITGTPSQPRVDFSLDMPTVSSDAKQMVHTLINTEEEMNQQVIYLLAVGRFLNNGTNNQETGDAERQSQTSLAMQSLLSGTLSQQLSQLLSNITRNQTWNLGANISTGDQGFYNAQYEGLLSGRLLNNRLILNGQFGYRDNPNATSSFIGDFDLRYLLRPDGNAAIHMYNQTNDRYFTRNSLNTQGIGLILKRDFTRLSDFFHSKR